MEIEMQRREMEARLQQEMIEREEREERERLEELNRQYEL